MEYNIETADYMVSLGEEEFEVHIMCGSFQVPDYIENNFVPLHVFVHKYS